MITDPRKALPEMERVLSRRAFFMKVGKGAGCLGAYERFGPRLFGTTPQTDAANYQQALRIVSAYGRMVIPVDQDPGWATFEPDITVYALDTYIRQVFNLGRDLAFNGFTQAVVAFNELPPVIRWGPRFLEMSNDTQGDYLTNILVGQFENDGVGDILGFAAVFMLLGVKQTFFLNFPKHRADPNADIQRVTGNSPKTGFDIMNWKGPVSAAEEVALRARTANAPELPGVDWRNPWI
jgi:hypothetical protein